MEQFNHKERREPKEQEIVGKTGAITSRVSAIHFPSSLPCVLCVLCGWPTALSGMNPNPHEKLRAEFCDLFPPPGQSFDCIMSP
jgi:hypothetical protein